MLTGLRHDQLLLTPVSTLQKKHCDQSKRFPLNCSRLRKAATKNLRRKVSHQEEIRWLRAWRDVWRVRPDNWVHCGVAGTQRKPSQWLLNPVPHSCFEPGFAECSRLVGTFDWPAVVARSESARAMLLMLISILGSPIQMSRTTTYECQVLRSQEKNRCLQR